MAGSCWRAGAALCTFAFLELLVSGSRESIFEHQALVTTPGPPSDDVHEVQHMIQQGLHLPEQQEPCPEVPDETSKPSVYQDLPFFDALLDRVIDVADIVDSGDEEPDPNEEESGESTLNSLIAAFEAFEDVVDIHGYPTLSNTTREATFTEARITLAQKNSDFNPEDLTVAARVVDAHGSWESAKKLCPPLPSEEDQALNEEAQTGILNAGETAIVETRTSQWENKVEELKAKCDGFRDLIKDKWNEYGEKVLAFERAHGKTWYSDFAGFEGNATPAFSYGQSTFNALTNKGVTPRGILTMLSQRLPSQFGADCLKKEEVCKLQQDPEPGANAPSEAEMHELQLSSHVLLLDYKKVCRVSAMSMLIEAAVKNTVTEECQKPWFRPMLCGDHHLWDTQEIVDAASHIASQATDGLDEAGQANDVLQTIFNPQGGILLLLKAGLDQIDFVGNLKRMIFERYQDQVELVASWYNWFSGWLAYGNYIWSAIGKVWRGFNAVATLGVSEATPSTSEILTYFVERSPWALKKAMVYYKESHQTPNCKKLVADESELPDV